MEIITQNLILKEYTLDNLKDYYKLKSCENVWYYSSFIPLTDIGEAEKLLRNLMSLRESNEDGFMALFTKGEENYIGEAGILSSRKSGNRCVIGYNLLPEYWNKGYATEITKSLVLYALKDLGYERVEALACSENKASCKVLEKSGFKCEGILRHFNKCGDSYRDVSYYGMISSDLK